MTDTELLTNLEKIIEKNVKEIPWEGAEINRNGIRDSIFELIKNITTPDDNRTT